MDNANKKEIIKRLLGDKRKLGMIIIAALGILLILFSLSGEKGENSTDSLELDGYKKTLEKELSELCSSVSGAGKCKVKVTFSEGAHAEYRGNNKISETPPKVLGITIISEGGDKSEVKIALTECMTALFDVKANRVAVLKMK